MKNMTGAIYVAGPLDYETRKRVSYHFEHFQIDHEFMMFCCNTSVYFNILQFLFS